MMQRRQIIKSGNVKHLNQSVE